MCEVITYCGFELYFSDVEHIFMYPLAICVSSLLIFNLVVCFLELELYEFFCCILDRNPLLNVSFANIFFHSVGSLFVLLIISFAVQRFLHL